MERASHGDRLFRIYWLYLDHDINPTSCYLSMEIYRIHGREWEGRTFLLTIVMDE